MRREFVITTHAVDRMIERFPVYRPPMPVRTVIHREIRQAFEAGRVSSRMPVWAALWTRERGRGRGTLRYVWNVEESRCYPVKRHRLVQGLHRVETWVVLSTLPTVTEEQRWICSATGGEIAA